MITSKRVRVMGTCLAAGFFVTSGWGQAPSEATTSGNTAAANLRVREGFQAPLVLMTKQGESIVLKVATHKWSIDGVFGRQSIRLNDFTLLQVRGGSIVTFIDGTALVKTADDYWTMPAGSVLTFKVKGETALLEVMTVSTK